MTVVDEPTTAIETPAVGDDSWDLDADTPEVNEVGEAVETEVDERPTLQQMARPLLATGLATVGSGLVVGGIFGSWLARFVCVLAAVIGTAWVYVSRRARNPFLSQILFFPVLLAVGMVLMVITAGASPDKLPELVGDAVNSGRLFRPPVPFDAGWRPLLVFLFGGMAFAAGSIAVVQERPKAGVGVVVPLTLLGLFSQPDDSTFLASVFAFLPILGALAVLFGDDGERANELGQEFEMRRAIQGGVGALAVVGLLLGVNSADFLFPDPVYNPDDRPQKPRAVPLSASQDRVLFEIATDSTLTGPWRIGALDVYDDDAFQSVPSESRLEPLPATGTLSPLRTGRTPITVTFTVRDLGDTAVLPTLAGATSISFQSDPPTLKIDPRYQNFRVPTGRVPEGLIYTLTLPPYATETELSEAARVDPSAFVDELTVPDPPPVVEELLRQAPENPWLRLDFLRQTLLDRVIASGQGSPKDVPASRVQEILSVATPTASTDDETEDAADGETVDEPEGNEASPYEIVATEALLARWAGIPSRIGFGFDGLNLEDEVLTIRPRNSAQWLEVWFPGYGWVPLIGQPDQAKASLDNDPNARATPTVEASRDVAVQVYVIYEQRSLQLLYQRLRNILFLYGPWLLGAVGLYLLSPGVAKVVRRRRRRAWASTRGPMAQIAVEYAEFRDVAIDLSVGDDYDTPLEYLGRVQYDREHEELAWLMTRAVYGDMIHTLSPADVEFAQRMSTSLRSRLMKAQPVQSRVLAFVSRASIELPWTDEFPNVRVIRIAPYAKRAWNVVASPVRGVRKRVGGAIVGVLSIPQNYVRGRLAAKEAAEAQAKLLAQTQIAAQAPVGGTP